MEWETAQPQVVENRIPEGMQASISVDHGLGSTEVTGDYRIEGNQYVSPGYDTAENRVDLAVHGDIGKVTIEQIQEL